jgi:hypothetical protein
MSAREVSGDFEQLLARWRALDAHPPTPALAQRLRALRAWQAARLAHTYQDLAREPQYAAAVSFFLSELYGPQDFTDRDRELERALSPLRRALPGSLLVVLAQAIELDLLTAELDRAMLPHLAEGPLTGAVYAAAYRALGRVAARRRQIALTVGIGEDLERLVQHPWIGLALRAAAVPARAAGFGVLQQFLERGFSAFRRMGNAQPLLDAIRERETRLMEGLLSGAGPLPHMPTAAGALHG